MSNLERYILPGQDVDVEVFVEPSREARRLAGLFGLLLAPEDGRGGAFSRFIGMTVVAPFTQFAPFSFNLQAFQYEVFHQTIWARLGHQLFMPLVNLFLIAALAQFRLPGVALITGFPSSLAHAGTLFAIGLATWYLVLAAKTRMALWFVATVPLLSGLLIAGSAWHDTHAHAGASPWYAPTPLWSNPWCWMMLSAFMVTFSHLPEAGLAPRANGTKRWIRLADYLGASDISEGRIRVIVQRLVRVSALFMTGILDELWASPRLMPYNVLMLMFRAGYRPEVYGQVRQWVDRALESGNPALDFVGIGGGAFLDPNACRERLI